MNAREIFLRHIAQTSPSPLALEPVKAEGCWIRDRSGKKYLDLIGGISVANTGHRHPAVIEAIKTQLDAYLHVMVYGEFIESPQVQYAQLLCEHLPDSLNSVYFTNSGAEAIEGAMKLAKRVTGGSQVVAFKNSYHGSTQGALSIIGDEYWRNAFRPLLPGISHVEYGALEALPQINNDTACVILETVQAEAGIIVPSVEWMQALRQKCDETGSLLVLDEVQAAFGRTGKLWGFEHFGIIPDILVLGKALGGGMPLGAFISAKEKMGLLAEDPVLGHITTFGGHPVCCAAGMAAMKVLLADELMQKIREKELLFQSKLKHPSIKQVRSFGLWMALEFESFEMNKRVIDGCLEKKDVTVLTDWFLFAPDCMRISPPLSITHEEIHQACDIILDVLNAS